MECRLYNYLVEEKGFSVDEALETVIRLDYKMDIPDQIQKDIVDYLKRYIKIDKRLDNGSIK